MHLAIQCYFCANLSCILVMTAFIQGIVLAVSISDSYFWPNHASPMGSLYACSRSQTDWVCQFFIGRVGRCTFCVAIDTVAPNTHTATNKIPNTRILFRITSSPHWYLQATYPLVFSNFSLRANCHYSVCVSLRFCKGLTAQQLPLKVLAILAKLYQQNRSHYFGWIS